MVKAIVSAALLAILCSVPARAEERLVLGVTPWVEPARLAEMYRPVVSFLEQELGRKVLFVVAADYADLAAKIRERKIDVGLFSPAAYVEARDRVPGLRYLVTGRRRDHTGEIRDHYKGVILARTDSGARSLGDLKGKRFAFTDRQSASGYIFPVALLKKRGIDPERFFSDVFLLKKHDKVLEAMMCGSIDGGATWDGELRQAVGRWGQVFTVLAETPPIPNDAYAAGPHVPDQLVRALRAAFLRLAPDSPAMVQAQALGLDLCSFSERSDAFYDVVREAYGPNR